MKKFICPVFFICTVLLCGACAILSPPHQPDVSASPASTLAPPETPFPSALTPTMIPGFPADAMQPLLHNIGIALSGENVVDFDASRGLATDRYFADALLYGFLNNELYDKSIQLQYNEQTFMCEIKAEDMQYLLRRYIGDYPALIQPPADIFLSQNEAGDYIFGHSDAGSTDYEMKVENITHIDEGLLEVSAGLYELDLDGDAIVPSTYINGYKLRFKKADDSAYGYTIISCLVDMSSSVSPTRS